jgi:hypothetical protein
MRPGWIAGLLVRFGPNSAGIGSVTKFRRVFRVSGANGSWKPKLHYGLTDVFGACHHLNSSLASLASITTLGKVGSVGLVV